MFLKYAIREGILVQVFSDHYIHLCTEKQSVTLPVVAAKAIM